MLCYGRPKSTDADKFVFAPTKWFDPAKAGQGHSHSGRVDVSEPASISLSIAGRYGQALFELAKETGALAALEADADALGDVLKTSPDFAAMIASPVIVREEQAAAVQAVAAAVGVSTLMANTLALMASKRRLFVMPQLVADLQRRIAAEKGEVTAEVTSAAPLSEDQLAKLMATLKASSGQDIKLNATVDESLIGGLIVKLGSTMIDTSVKAKLAALQNAMKEVG
jgi:F-type H+-transporting ATPase subunit delta